MTEPLTKEEWAGYAVAVGKSDAYTQGNIMHSQIVAYVQDLESQLIEVRDNRELLAMANESNTDLIYDLKQQLINMENEAMKR